MDMEIESSSHSLKVYKTDFLNMILFINKRPLGLTAPLSNNTRSMIYNPMNTK